MSRAAAAFLLLTVAAGTPLPAASEASASRAALATGSRYATQAGLRVLQRGGNAADSAVAVALVLAVVQPQSGNLGGGGFLVYYQKSSRSVWTLDFREVAPGAAKRDMFTSLPRDASRTGALAAGIPGTVAGLEALHRRFGKLAWNELFAEAIALAAEGFPLDPGLAATLDAERKARSIDRFPSTASLFFPTENPVQPGGVLVQKELADTLTRLRSGGAREFYRGETARRLVRSVRDAGGNFSHTDLSRYEPVWRAPITVRFHDTEVHLPPPPSAGGVVLGQSLGIFGGFASTVASLDSAAGIHRLMESFRRAFIDRNRLLGDPAAIRIPYTELFSAERADQWRASIVPDRITATATLVASMNPQSPTQQTTHLSIVDASGDAVSLTTSLSGDFGSGFLAPGLGFFLNAAMHDFSGTNPGADGEGLPGGRANDAEPGKRMLSPMTPLIVTRDRLLLLAAGTSGGAAIPTTMTQFLLRLIRDGQDIAVALKSPRFHHEASPDQVSYERGAPASLVDALNAMGHAVVEREAIGEINAVLVEKESLRAVADPRGSGAAGGLSK